jgi:hypothetical protein
MSASPPRSIAVAKTAESDHAWRFRTLLACAFLALAVLTLGALELDWSEGLAMALGQMAGMAAPLVMLGVGIWALCAWIGRKA